MQQIQDDTRTISINDIIRDQGFQVRNRIDQQTVKNYVSAMQAGSQFPPVTVAEIEERLFLIDGFHRYAAATETGRQEIEAVVVKMTEREARRAAALANLTHGLPLKQGEKRNVFRQYIRGNGHKKARGKFKSYREIAADLHGIAAHTCIRNWMEKDFPSIYRQMGDDKTGNGQAESPRIDPQRERVKQVREALRDARALFPTISDPCTRYEVWEELRGFLREAEKLPMEKPDF